MHPTIEKIQRANLQKVPEIRTGYTVRVSQKIKEGSKERVQNFEGLVIKVSHGSGVEKTFTVRKIVEGIGVEKIFPFHSPNVTKIHVIKKAKVRREKLYYMRERFGKSARLSERHVTDEERAKEEAKMEALYAEAVKHDEKVQAEATAEEAPAAEETAKDIPQDDTNEASEAADDSSDDKPTDEVAEAKEEEGDKDEAA